MMNSGSSFCGSIPGAGVDPRARQGRADVHIVLAIEPIAVDEHRGLLSDWEASSGRASVDEWVVEQRQ
eukprot:3620583-Pyramimonas_sp.AAC.1